MPVPNQNESQEDFISRCIPFVLSEGTASNIPQAYAMCEYIYENNQNANSKNQPNQTESEESTDNQGF